MRRHLERPERKGARREMNLGREEGARSPRASRCQAKEHRLNHMGEGRE